MRLLASILLLGLITGCSYTRDQTRHVVIFGFGVVSVPAIQSPEVSVVKINSLGVAAASVPGLRVGVGYTSALTIMANTNANALIDVNQNKITIEK